MCYYLHALMSLYGRNARWCQLPCLPSNLFSDITSHWKLTIIYDEKDPHHRNCQHVHSGAFFLFGDLWLNIYRRSLAKLFLKAKMCEASPLSQRIWQVMSGMLALIINTIQQRITWETNLSEELSTLCWPVGMLC